MEAQEIRKAILDFLSAEAAGRARSSLGASLPLWMRTPIVVVGRERGGIAWVGRELPLVPHVPEWAVPEASRAVQDLTGEIDDPAIVIFPDGRIERLHGPGYWLELGDPYRR
jgi:hypothetical protein